MTTLTVPLPAVAARPRATSTLIEPLSFASRAMGGRLVIHLFAPAADRPRAERAASVATTRIGRWADRLSRHRPASELSLLNGDLAAAVRVGPTLARALEQGQAAARLTGGLVDVALLDARLAAEAGLPVAPPAADRAWRLVRAPDGRALVQRAPGLRFDLDGVAKGWLADRALGLLAAWPGAVIDADGDLAVRCPPGRHWAVAVDDPRGPDGTLAILHLSAPAAAWPSRWGVATSGTSVHRWRHGGELRHHLIDPRTGRPAVTDIVQATVVAASAAEAEALAKAAVIAGSEAGLALLETVGARGAVLLTERGEVIASPRTLGLLDEPAGA